MRSYGSLKYWGGQWVVDAMEPHVAIRFKLLFPRVPKSKAVPYCLDGTAEVANELDWFIKRYPLEMNSQDREQLWMMAKMHRHVQEQMEQILSASHVHPEFKINGQLRDYQAKFVEFALAGKRCLNGDTVGLGKTVEALAVLTDPNTRHALIVVQAHLPIQWCKAIVQFLSMKPHVIRGTRPYHLPPADVYVTTYSRLVGWVDVFNQGVFKTVIYDEVQELRRSESEKYKAAKVLSAKAEYVFGLSATPVYNYGEEIFNIMENIKPGALGNRMDFEREWCGLSKAVKDPKALGTYLREQHLFLRRTRADVGRELPPINKIVHTVGHDEVAVKNVEELARSLALKVTTGTFVERGEAARELDMMMRMVTGVSKAKFVAEYVKILLENDEPVLLVGWHRDVYEIWMKELAAFNPVLYTGSESGTQKNAARDAFVSGKSNLMIMSLRSGIGVDGLQERCSYVVFGELDWSPAVQEQVIGRLGRDGQQKQVTAIYLVSDGGSDPPMMDLLGIKASQSAGILDPFGAQTEVHRDDSRIKALAQHILSKRGVTSTIDANVQI